MDMSYRRINGTGLVIAWLCTLVAAVLGSPIRVLPTTASTSAPIALATLSGNGLNVPKGIAVVGTQVWVANNGTSTISRFNQDGTSAGTPLSGNGLNSPYGIAMVGAQVWVSNHGNNTISLFTPNGTSAGSPLSGNGLNGPRGGAAMGSPVWIPNYNNSTLSL